MGCCTSRDKDNGKDNGKDKVGFDYSPVFRVNNDKNDIYKLCLRDEVVCCTSRRPKTKYYKIGREKIYYDDL